MTWRKVWAPRTRYSSIMLANCLHDLTALGPGGLGPLLLTMLVAGLAGGATHCAGMCAPFVLAQVTANAAQHGGGTLARLSGAGLVPYHLGRMLGYSALGAIGGGGIGALSQLPGFRQLLGVMLLLAAFLMVRQALSRLPHPWRFRFQAGAPAMTGRGGRAGGRYLVGLWNRIRRPAQRASPKQSGVLMQGVSRLLAKPTGWNGIGLGLLLSGLPCGLLYAALAASAATGSALAGAMSMLAFTVGTVPSLFGVALLGRFFLRGSGNTVRIAGAALFLVNGGVLMAMAARLLG
ncbi:urease accessory protein UreH domain-containing protein [Falsiroseomonas sp. E2-1-a20]|uniref:urease accessory protein UreH domain-containing protein n=1 Tax=Falsiroseomonas sp. E2-1-a20 TaxID=3239300 RepID=UPI003F3E497E